jgi:hypothetical protein
MDFRFSDLVIVDLQLYNVSGARRQQVKGLKTSSQKQVVREGQQGVNDADRPE